MDERILITGGAGFIGLKLAQTIVARNTPITIIDNFARGKRDAELQALLEHEQVTFVEHDLTCPIPKGLLDNNYTQIYHCAAVVGVRTCNEMPHYVLSTNLLSTIHILEWCRRQPQPVRFCLASTSEVYAGSVQLGIAPIPTPENVPLTILDPAVPRLSYLSSKIVGEQLCISYARAYNIPVRIVRYHNIYGPRMGYDHVIPQFIERILQRQDPFKIFGAYQTRAFCYIDDAVEATIRVMALPASEPITVHIGNDEEELPIIDMAQKLFQITNFAPHLEIHEPPPASPARRCPDISYLRRLTAFTPQVHLVEGLQRTYAWYHAEYERQHNLKLSVESDL